MLFTKQFSYTCWHPTFDFFLYHMLDHVTNDKLERVLAMIQGANQKALITWVAIISKMPNDAVQMLHFKFMITQHLQYAVRALLLS